LRIVPFQFLSSKPARALVLAWALAALTGLPAASAHVRHHARAHGLRRAHAASEPPSAGVRIDPALFARLSPELQAKLLHLRGVRIGPPEPVLAFQPPLPGRAVNSRFGLRQLSFEPAARMHEGVDIAAPIGVPIHASASGKVLSTGVSPTYGRFVEVSHGKGVTTFYAHMSRTAGLKRGAWTAAGGVLGYVGSTGRSTGPHLHFEIRKDGVALDPQRAMGREFASVQDLPTVAAPALRRAAARHAAHGAFAGRGYRGGFAIYAKG
jgi:murein DD-endopeptidase MepM/ murein hydrolase activator NlpD